MDPRDVRTAEDALALVNERDLSHVKLGLVDIDGVMRGKYMARDKFARALEKGFGFCDVIVGWDVDDGLYDNAQYTGWHTGYPDAEVRVLPDTCRTLPFEDDGLLFLCEFAPPGDEICPRGLLRRVLASLDNIGYQAKVGFEYEFTVFNETPHSIRDKSYRNLKPLTPGFFGYSILHNSIHSDFYNALLGLCDEMDFTLEGLHEESGPGIMEGALIADEALAAADKAALFKTFAKVLAQKRDLMATFMARWSMEYPGQSGHIHISIQRKSGDSAFHDPDAPHFMSSVMHQFLAGQQNLMPSFLAMIAPTVNSYRRLVPGFWAPDWASAGIDNRTCALRVIPGGPDAIRIEYRIAAADANPYIVLAAALASGLHGIENEVGSGDLVEGNAYDKVGPPDLRFASTLGDAASRLRNSAEARASFGEAFVEHFVASREWEEREFRKQIAEWELDRYFEII